MGSGSSIGAESQTRAQVARHSFPRAIWFPAALSAALLFGVAVTFFWLSQRIDAHRRRFSEVLQPVHQQLAQLQLDFLEELAAWRSFQLQPTEWSRAEVALLHARTHRTIDELSRNATRVGSAFVGDVARLGESLSRWQTAPAAVMSGQMALDAYRQLPQQRGLSRGVLTQASQLTSAVSRETGLLMAEMQRLERRRLLILGGIFPLALLGVVLTAWFAKRAMSSHRLALDNAAHEALLRDAMAALTAEQVLPAALNRIATSAMRVADADGAFIERCDEARSNVEIVAAVGTNAPPAGVHINFPGSITDEIARAGSHEVIADLSAHSGELGRMMGDEWKNCFALAVPLHSQGDLNGALVLIRRGRPIQLRPETVSRLEVLGSWAALALRRQQLTSELEVERARLETLVDEIPMGVVLVDALTGRVVKFNRHAVELWGSPSHAPQSINEHRNWKLFHLDGTPYQTDERPLARSILEGEVVRCEEAEIERADGTRRIVQINSTPIRDTRGAIIAGVAAFADISEEKSREAISNFLDDISSQLASTLEYDATIEAVLQLMVPRFGDLASIHHRQNGNVIRRLTGGDPKVIQILEDIDREYPLPLPSAHPVAVAIRTGKSQLREVVGEELLKAISKDERQLNWLRSLGIKSAMAVPLIVRGKTVGALQIMSANPARHYTCEDLNLAEEIARRAALAIDNALLFRTIKETSQSNRFMSDAAMTLSGSLEYEEVLRLITQLAVPFMADFALGYVKSDLDLPQHSASAHCDHAKDALLQRMARIYRPDPTNLGSTVIRALSTGQPVVVEEVSAELLDGMGFEPQVRELVDALAPVSWMTIPLVARNKTLGAIIFGSAESARRYGAKDVALAQRLASRAAMALQNAMFYRSVQDALITRDEVLAVVSHDLRNPLNTIGLSTQTLTDIPLEEKERRHHFEVIGRARDRMDRLIQDLLDVTRVEGGKALVMDCRRERPAAFVREACELFVSSTREKGVQFEWRVAEEIPDVHVDVGRMLQVLTNLIGNALKFTPEGGRIEVHAVADKGMVMVSVHDTGPGIAPEDLNLIFHSFWQAPRAARLGAGLGLAISRGIVEQHGGQIWAKSREGAGASFFFTLPTAEAQNELQAAD